MIKITLCLSLPMKGKLNIHVCNQTVGNIEV